MQSRTSIIRAAGTSVVALFLVAGAALATSSVVGQGPSSDAQPVSIESASAEPTDEVETEEPTEDATDDLETEEPTDGLETAAPTDELETEEPTSSAEDEDEDDDASPTAEATSSPEHEDASPDDTGGDDRSGSNSGSGHDDADDNSGADRRAAFFGGAVRSGAIIRGAARQAAAQVAAMTTAAAAVTTARTTDNRPDPPDVRDRRSAVEIPPGPAIMSPGPVTGSGRRVPVAPTPPGERATEQTVDTEHRNEALADDRRLVDDVLGGDREAFRLLVDREGPALVAACTRVLGDRSEAEDVAQEAFVIAYRSLGIWRGEGSLGAWLARIGVRLAVRRAASAAPGRLAGSARGRCGPVGIRAVPHKRGRIGRHRSRPARDPQRTRCAAADRGCVARRAVSRGRRAPVLRGTVAGGDRDCDRPTPGNDQDAAPPRPRTTAPGARGDRPMTGPPPNGQSRRFGIDEIDGADGLRPDDLPAELRLARELEGLAIRSDVAPSAAFSDRVMAAIEDEPSPVPARAAGRAIRHGSVAALLASIRDAWRVTVRPGFPAMIRAQALAMVLVVVALGAGTATAAAGALGLFDERAAPSPPPSLDASPLPSVAPSPSPSLSPSPEPSATPLIRPRPRRPWRPRPPSRPARPTTMAAVPGRDRVRTTAHRARARGPTTAPTPARVAPGRARGPTGRVRTRARADPDRARAPAPAGSGGRAPAAPGRARTTDRARGPARTTEADV